MKTIRAAFTILAISIACMTAQAQTTHRIKNHTAQTALALVPLDGSGASLAFTANVTGYAVMNVYLHHVVNATATAVVMTCTTSPDGGTTDYVMQSCLVSAGDCTSSDASWTKAVAAAAKWPWQVSVIGYSQATCTLAGTAAGATDTVSASYHLVTQ